MTKSYSYVIHEDQAKHYIVLNSMILILTIALILISQIFWLLLPATICIPISLLASLYIYRRIRRQIRIWWMGAEEAAIAEERSVRSISVLSQARRRLSSGHSSTLVPTLLHSGPRRPSSLAVGGKAPNVFVTANSNRVLQANANDHQPTLDDSTATDTRLMRNGVLLEPRQSVASSQISDDPFLSVSVSRHTLGGGAQPRGGAISDDRETISDVRLQSSASSIDDPSSRRDSRLDGVYQGPTMSDLVQSSSSSDGRHRYASSSVSSSVEDARKVYVNKAMSRVLDNRIPSSTSSDDPLVRKSHHQKVLVASENRVASTSSADEAMLRRSFKPPTLVPLDIPQLSVDQKLRLFNRPDSEDATPPVDYSRIPRFHLPKLNDPRVKLQIGLQSSTSGESTPPGAPHHYRSAVGTRVVADAAASHVPYQGGFPAVERVSYPPIIHVQSLDEKGGVDDPPEQAQLADRRATPRPLTDSNDMPIPRGASRASTVQVKSIDVSVESRKPSMISTAGADGILQILATNSGSVCYDPSEAATIIGGSTSNGGGAALNEDIEMRSVSSTSLLSRNQFANDMKQQLSDIESTPREPSLGSSGRRSQATIKSVSTEAVHQLSDRKVSELQYRRSLTSGAPLLPPIVIDQTN